MEGVCQPFGRKLAVVFVVIQQIVVSKRHIHIGAVADIVAVDPVTAAQGMGSAAQRAPLLMRLIQTHEQQGEERHVVAEAQAGGLGGAGLDLAADTAVDAAVAIFLRFG